MMPKLTRTQFDEVVRRQKAHEEEQREQLRLRVAGSAAPLPSELRADLVRLFNGHMREIMRDHRGYRLAGKRDSYLTSLAILRRSLRTLLAMISRFEAEALAEDTNLFGPAGEERLREIELDIQKELFTCTNAAVSLVDHARRVAKAASIADYNAKRLECFGADGLHELVASLRVLLHHLHVVDAGWNLTADYYNGEKTASFVLDKGALTRIISENKKALTSEQRAGAGAYIAAQPSSIDLRKMFADYATRVDRFNDWLTSELQSESIVALHDYDSILQEKVLRDQRMMYHALLGNWLSWERPPDPHDHLHRYLSAKQLKAVYRLPRNSREQVDLAISYADREGIVDDRIREKIYELFQRSGRSLTEVTEDAATSKDSLSRGSR